MVKCFLCEKDITDKIKVISYYRFPDKLWDEASKNWARNFRELFNGCLCSDCAKRDFEAISEKTVAKYHAEWMNEIRSYKKLFGRIYIKQKNETKKSNIDVQ